ncbi:MULTISPECIES: IclR family transcriptional regulator [Lysinibacillus]|uniref:Glycerol operon regulatory protein n=1 Tax=Lysinibacillus antri TaxID=2498145 RepID=A0A3S0PM26_9BACI|nr:MULTISPECIES: IclR family transcriptional regulator [Lysinibacillus]RUL47376.1 IclR family transcriptional regulator [Lysinibacillus antri]TSI09007.1 IclR family transcriptional regulator [Lysinibacillus sp. BW-2-10]
MKPQNDLLESVHNALRLLKLFTKDQPMLGTVEIAELLGIHRSSVSRILRTLLTEGFVMKDTNSPKYRLGPTIFSLGQFFTESNDLYQISLDTMKELTQITGETTQLGVVDDLDVLIIGSVESSHPLRFMTMNGDKTPLYSSSLGRALIAFSDDSLLTRILMQERTPRTKKSIIEEKSFIEEIKKVRIRGYSTSVEEKYDGVNALAVPILNANGQAIGAINIAGPAHRLRPEKFQKIANHLLKASEEISKEYEFYTGPAFI